jgi:quercetin dioxygenase-like cupin family protein
MSQAEEVDLLRVKDEASTAGSSGVAWSLKDSVDLNANLVRFPDGEGVGEHVNREVDVLFVGVSGSGFAVVDGHEHRLRVGKAVLAPRGTRRSTRSDSADFAYLTVHRRRGPLRIGRPDNGDL